jgi:hypothetical protein
MPKKEQNKIRKILEKPAKCDVFHFITIYKYVGKLLALKNGRSALG